MTHTTYTGNDNKFYLDRIYIRTKLRYWLQKNDYDTTSRRRRRRSLQLYDRVMIISNVCYGSIKTNNGWGLTWHDAEMEWINYYNEERETPREEEDNVLQFILAVILTPFQFALKFEMQFSPLYINSLSQNLYVSASLRVRLKSQILQASSQAQTRQSYLFIYFNSSQSNNDKILLTIFWYFSSSPQHHLHYISFRFGEFCVLCLVCVVSSLRI